MMKTLSPIRIAKQVLLGTALGDSSLGKVSDVKARYRCGHSVWQFEYLMHKLQLLYPLVGTYELRVRIGRSYSQNPFFGVRTKSSKYLKHIYDDCYISGEKGIRVNVLRRLTPIGIAFWYMDDGCLGTWKNTISSVGISTHGFGRDSSQIICDYFKEKYCIDFYVTKGGGIKTTNGSRANAIKFIDIVRDHIPQCMDYKINPASFRKTRRPEIQDGDVLRTLQKCKELFRNEYAFHDAKEKLASWK